VSAHSLARLLSAHVCVCVSHSFSFSLSVALSVSFSLSRVSSMSYVSQSLLGSSARLLAAAAHSAFAPRNGAQNAAYLSTIARTTA
jgi:hypothetical protein